MSLAEVGYIGFCCSYSGKFFAGYAGYIKGNKPGEVRHKQGEMRKNLLSTFDKRVIYMSGSYNETSFSPEVGKRLIYCDPPYEGVTGYKTDSFNHTAFWQWCRNMKAKGHTVFVSEYNAPSDFKCVWKMEIKDRLSTANTILKTEKLFTL